MKIDLFVPGSESFEAPVKFECNITGSRNHIAILLLSPRLYNTFLARAYQPTIGLISTCPQSEVKDHLPSLGGMCGQHAEPPAVFDF